MQEHGSHQTSGLLWPVMGLLAACLLAVACGSSRSPTPGFDGDTAAEDADGADGAAAAGDAADSGTAETSQPGPDDTGLSAPEAGSEGPPDAALGGDACEGEVGCGPDATVDVVTCRACAGDDECDEGTVCVHYGAGEYCASPCATSGDCPSGFQCLLFGARKACAPGEYACTGCLAQGGCGSGQHCNPDSAECTQDKAPCETCLTDGDCGPGLRCYSGSQGKQCVPECVDGGCPANTSCTAIGDGVHACVWSFGGTCCFGAGCPTDACGTCSAAAPFCSASGACVQCLTDSDCPGPFAPTCSADGTCQPGEQCTADPGKPHYNAGTGTCCECLNSAHCGGKPCDPSTCACKTTGGSGGVCNTCVAPYPGCATYNGQAVCVQCSEAAHCLSGQCNLTTYMCEGEVVPTTGDCSLPGKGCPGTLTCHAASGLCYDAGGNCDNVTQFCPNGGTCIAFTDVVPAGGGGGIPTPDPGPGGALPGGCECLPGPMPGLDQGNCPSGLTCNTSFFGILALIDPTITVPYTCAKSVFGP
jgi:hypothetical protein